MHTLYSSIKSRVLICVFLCIKWLKIANQTFILAKHCFFHAYPITLLEGTFFVSIYIGVCQNLGLA